MAFSWNRFAYTNFHELNLDWFSEHFKEIFEEWESLYNTLTQWKTDTDADLAQWKEDTLAAMDSWENDLLDALDQWKAATGEDIGEWESDVISDLNDWKSDFIEAYEALEDRVEAIVSDTEDMVENLAEPFSTSNNYNAGDYIVYNGVLYMFTTDHSAGAWTGSDVVQRTAMNDISDLKKEMLMNYESYDFTIQNSRIAPATGVPIYNNNSWRTDYIPCEAGETVEFRGRSCWYDGSPIGALVTFYTAERQFISSIAKFSDSETSNTTGKLTTVTPENTAYIIAGTYSIVNESYIHIKNREKFIESIPEIDERLKTVEKSVDKIGYYENTFGVTANTAHSSQLDKLPVDIKSGVLFTVEVTGVASGGQIYGYYNNLASNVRLAHALTFTGTAEQDLEAIGVYFAASDLPTTGNITVKVWKNNYIYGKTSRIPDEKNIITTVLGASLPADTTTYGVTSEYASAMKNAIDAWMAYYAGDDQAIPFIVHTDQHGSLTAARQGVFNLLDYLVNWDGISAIFNLGDTVVDHWEDDNTNTNPLLRNETLEAARICLENIPSDKRIDVYGNHDTWYSGAVSTPVAGTLPSMQYNNPYFPSRGLITRKCPDNSGLAVVYDTALAVKYLILAGWDYADKTGTYVGYQWYWINQAHLDWIVQEMGKNDGYDLILVSHVPLQMGSTGCIDPITGDAITETVPIYITHYDPFLLPLWNARKNKTNGSVSSNGVSVSYDFRNCETDCLIALSGHTHYDGIQYLNNADTGLLNVSFDRFQNLTIHFGVIDRGARKIKVWKLANDSDTPSVTAWEKPLDKA